MLGIMLLLLLLLLPTSTFSRELSEDAHLHGMPNSTFVREMGMPISTSKLRVMACSLPASSYDKNMSL